jgi:hypothetical protein
METLAQLAAKYNTDKKAGGHGYVKMYETILKTIEVNSLLEIGLGSGASMRMWLEYYPNADIYCMEDFGEENRKIWHGMDGNIEGLKLIKGDSKAIETWKTVPQNLSVIIDDGDHHPQAQLETFLCGFPHLKSGGLYFIEDLHCNFQPQYTDKDIIYPWIFNLILEQQTPKYVIGGNFYQGQAYMGIISREIYSYHFYKSVAVFERV